MIKNGLSAALKFNRCLEFTLPDGKTVTVKVLGEKPAASADAKLLHAALTAE